MKRLISFFKDEEGVTAIEYSLIAALIAVVIIIGVTTSGTAVSNTFAKVSHELNSAPIAP